MKHLLIATAVASFLFIQPATAGSLAEPIMENDTVTQSATTGMMSQSVMDEEIVAQAAMDDSTGKQDALWTALFLSVFLAMAGGAF